MECEAVNFVMNQNVEDFECIVAKLFQYTCSVMIIIVKYYLFLTKRNLLNLCVNSITTFRMSQYQKYISG